MIHPAIIFASAFAIGAHSAIGQVRKYTGEPYWKHPEAVAGMVARVTDDPEAIAAAWLHDVLEDTQVTYEQLCEAVGLVTADLVKAVTDVSRPEDGNRKVRKALDLEHLRSAPPLAQTIKVADMIDNSKSILSRDPNFAKVYIPEKKAQLQVLTSAHPDLIKTASDIIHQYEIDSKYFQL